MFRFIILLCCISLYSCKSDSSSIDLTLDKKYAKDSLRLFSAIDKDSACFLSYHFDKQIGKGGVINYIYESNEAGSFAIACDTSTKYFKVTFNNSDTTLLYIEGERFYKINGTQYRVLKLVTNKGVTDGEFSYFVSVDFGLLLSRSNTWRISEVINPAIDNSERLKLTALLYRVITEDDFFKNEVPESKVKFTQPEVE